LIKNTWNDHPDYKNLVSALEKMRQTATHSIFLSFFCSFLTFSFNVGVFFCKTVNEKKREADAAAKVDEVQSSMVGLKKVLFLFLFFFFVIVLLCLVVLGNVVHSNCFVFFFFLGFLLLLKNLAIPGRKYVKEEIVNELVNGTENQRYLFVFNDIFVLCHQKKDKSFQFLDMDHLHSVSIEDSQESKFSLLLILFAFLTLLSF
jgi:hypothetical protein